MDGMMPFGASNDEQAPGLKILAESALARSGFRLTFPHALEARYWRDIGLERLRELRFIALCGVAGYFGLGVLLNLTILPSPDFKNVAIQLVGSTLVVLAIIHVWLNERATVAAREAALLVACLICTLGAIVVVAAKPTPATLRDFLQAIPPAIFVLIFVRLRFYQACAFIVANIGVYALSLMMRPEIDRSDAGFLIGFMITLLLPALVGTHAFEKFSRRIYLHRLLERLRSEVLASQNATLTGLSYTDSLTNVANRRRLDEALLELVSAPGTNGALLLIDIDLFKAFNDRHGHLAGDACLCRVAQCLQANLRSFDLLARFGGEEFAVLLMDMTLADAMRAAERLRKAVEHVPFVVQDTRERVTVSIGVASREGLITPEALIGAADTALYAAKDAGRNRVEMTPIELERRTRRTA